MKNRVVLITGVLGGIGAATAKLFSDSGWYVVGIDLAQAPANLAGIDYFIKKL